MADSWKTVAMILGKRMENHAFCPDNHQPLKPEDCPFCADLVAYRRFQAKRKSDHE